MVIIEGLESAKPLLARQADTELYPVSASLKQRLMELFGTEDPEQAVRQIINEVRNRGDEALFDYSLKIDGIKLSSLELDKRQITSASQKTSPELVSALKLAAEQIRSFHSAQKEKLWGDISMLNSGQLIRPLERIGIYVPGGSASYPSTVLMTTIPARAAGVKEIFLATPPKSDGLIPTVTLAAANIARVDRVFCVGGAQAIAALTFGTETIPKVDKICGPGNIFVVLAKKLVCGVVGIDGLQGPSEVLIIADETANPKYCAADLLAQAEHDSLASAILITTSHQLGDEVNREVERQLQNLPRQAIATESLNNRGKIIVVNNVTEAVELANLYAPEHLCLIVDEAASYIDKVTNTGCIFTGNSSTVVLGDYVAGPSHVLPTGGTARFSSPLNVSDFTKFINLIAIDEASLKRLGPAGEIIARAEEFEGHARAIRKRMEALD